MTRRNLLLAASVVLALIALSANADSRPKDRTRSSNPIVIESQIQNVSIDGDTVTIRLYRQPYDFVAPKWLRVRTPDDRAMYMADLHPRDTVRIEGDLDQSGNDPFDSEHRGIVTVSRAVLQAREEHRP